MPKPLDLKRIILTEKDKPWEKCNGGLIYKAVVSTYVGSNKKICRRVELQPRYKLSPCYKCEWRRKKKCWGNQDDYFWEDPSMWLEQLDLEHVIEGRYYQINFIATESWTDWGKEYDTEIELEEVKIEKEECV